MNAIQRFNPDTSFTGVSDTLLVRAGVVPEQMLKENKIVDTWEGRVTVRPVNFGGTSNTLEITFPKVPRCDCEQWTALLAAEALRVVVNGTIVAQQGSDIAPLSNRAFSSCQAEENEISILRMG